MQVRVLQAASWTAPTQRKISGVPPLRPRLPICGVSTTRGTAKPRLHPRALLFCTSSRALARRARADAGLIRRARLVGSVMGHAEARHGLLAVGALGRRQGLDGTGSVEYLAHSPGDLRLPPACMQALQGHLDEARRAKELAAILASKEVADFAADKALSGVGHRLCPNRARADCCALSRRCSAVSCPGADLTLGEGAGGLTTAPSHGTSSWRRTPR